MNYNGTGSEPLPGIGLEVRAAEVFVAVAEELHFGRAADRVHMTQPAISRHVSRLEAGLGVMLLKRSNRRVKLTPEGRSFVRAAREVVVASRRAVETAQLARSGGIGQIRVGSAGTFPNELAGRVVREHRRDHSAVEIVLSQWSYVSSPAAGVDRGLVDVALVRAPVVASNIHFKPLVHERRMLALSNTHPLAHRNSISLDEIAGEPFVSSVHWPQRVRDYWAGVDDGGDTAYEFPLLADNPGEWLNAIAEGRGVSLCPASIASYYRRDDLSYVWVADLAPNPVGLAWRHDRHGPLLRNFIDGAAAYALEHRRNGAAPPSP